MAKGIRYSEEFKQEAVNQVVHHNYPVAEVAERLGISSKTLYNCLLSRICGSLAAWVGSQVHDIRQLPRPDRCENHRNFS